MVFSLLSVITGKGSIVSMKDWIEDMQGMNEYQLYPEANILNLPILVSDHSPIILDTNAEKKRRSRTYKVKNWCLNLEQPKEIVAEVWNRKIDGSPMFKCSRKLQQVRYGLFKWCKKYQVENNIVWDDIVEDCVNSQKQIKISEDVHKAKEVRENGIKRAMIKLDYWKQRAKGKWVALGG